MAESEKTHRVVIVGAGFAGFNAIAVYTAVALM